MINFSNYGFIYTSVAVVQTHNFIHYKYINTVVDGGKDLTCKNCGIMLFCSIDNRGYMYNFKNGEIMNYTCDEYMIYKVLL